MIKLACAAATLTASAVTSAATFSQGRAAYEANNVGSAEQIYSTVAADPGSPESDRAEANIELARIAWLIDGKADAALTRLGLARAAGAKWCEIALMEARVLRESKRLERATTGASSLLGLCPKSNKQDEIRLQVLRSHLDRAAAAPRHSSAELAAAAAQLSALGVDTATGLEGAAARLEIGLLTGDAETAYRGWQDYFWLGDKDGPPALASFTPRTRFVAGLGKDASDDARVELAYMLVRAGFAEASRRFAVAFALPGNAPNPHWRLLEAYWNQRAKLTAIALQVNRRLARGGAKDDQALQQAAQAALGALMAKAGATGDPRKAILDHYGLIGTVGLTSGYPSLHIGHVVHDRKETVEQYGRRAEVRFVEIDNMWANGFESWLWDGSAQAGGWAADGSIIIQVRPAYASAPFAAANLIGDTVERRELLARQPARAAEDLAKARSDAPVTLNGLNDRLRLQMIDQIATAVRSRGSMDDFRRAFLEEYQRANLQQSIFIHEGRHAIDQAMAKEGPSPDSEKLEYQAKLSELALADYPRMGLWNMSRGIGGSSPHDRAGTRIFNSIADWIRTNARQVNGFDPGLPPAVQIDKLTDGQIREIARSLDPLARGEAATASGDNPS